MEIFGKSKFRSIVCILVYYLCIDFEIFHMHRIIFFCTYSFEQDPFLPLYIHRTEKLDKVKFSKVMSKMKSGCLPSLFHLSWQETGCGWYKGTLVIIHNPFHPKQSQIPNLSMLANDNCRQRYFILKNERNVAWYIKKFSISGWEIGQSYRESTLLNFYYDIKSMLKA